MLGDNAMNLNAIRVILVETSHPGNIGAAARAMKTMGLSRLYLVKPKFFPDKNATEMASGAQDLLMQAVCVETLDEALLDVQLALMTSARPREIALPGLTPEAAAKKIKSFLQQTNETDKTVMRASAVALVFGRERTGLSNEELLRGHYHIEIPTYGAYASLNLAQAVQIIAYEILKVAAVEPHESPELPGLKLNALALANMEQLAQYYAHLESVLEAIQFLKAANAKQVMLKLRRLFNRAQLEGVEINLLRGILTQIMWALKNANEIFF